MVLRRNRNPNVTLDYHTTRRRMSIADRIKENKETDDNEEELRLERLGFNERYFNNR